MKRRIAVDLSILRDSRNLRLLVIGELFSGLRIAGGAGRDPVLRRWRRSRSPVSRRWG
jgi:hypothetical protein